MEPKKVKIAEGFRHIRVESELLTEVFHLRIKELTDGRRLADKAAQIFGSWADALRRNFRKRTPSLAHPLVRHHQYTLGGIEDVAVGLAM
jgi:hypothetical protein